ncbi:MAG: hypothetical protein ACYDBB_13190 [Armatimonadota bacterium]
MNPSDQTVKLRIVLLTAAFGLVGFFLEVGPVGGAFQQTRFGLSIELPIFGFLAYFALAASAAVGLHLSESEPTPKEETPETANVKPSGTGEAVGERVRARPELHQLRMFLTALGGYALLKGISFALVWPLMGTTASRYLVDTNTLVKAFQFGFIYIGLGWFVLWQLLRWYAQQRRWVRLQEELLGVDVSQMVALVLLAKPVIFFLTVMPQSGPQYILSALLHLAIVATAVVLWLARPNHFWRAIAGLLIIGILVILLTVMLVIVERAYAG